MGTGGIPIRIRRTETDSPTGPSLGEPFLNLNDNSIGIMGVTGMAWYPGIDPVTGSMILKQGQELSGKDSAGNNTVSLDFSDPDSMKIVHSGGTTLANFSSAGSSFHNLATTQLPGGYHNRMTHPGFISQFFSTTAISSSTSSGQFVGPNTYMWKLAGAVGDMSAVYDDTLSTTLNGVEINDALKITVSGGPGNGIGIRSWLFDSYSYVDAQAFLSVWAATGTSMSIRLGNADVGYNTTTIIGNSDWQRVSVAMPSHAVTASWKTTNKPIGFDVCHNPTDGDFWIAEPTLQHDAVSVSEIYQARSVGHRLAETSRFYWTPHYIDMNADDLSYVNLPYPALFWDGTNTDYEVSTPIADTPVNISGKDAFGFTAQAIATTTGKWKFRPVVAMRGDLSDIS